MGVETQARNAPAANEPLNESFAVTTGPTPPRTGCDTLDRIAEYANIILTKLRDRRAHWRSGHATVTIDFLFRPREYRPIPWFFPL